MSNSLECRAIRKTGMMLKPLGSGIHAKKNLLGDICVAQYLPRMLKDEYFGILSLLGYNMLRCNLTKSRELELIILMSLMTVLDKSNDASWKRDPISKGVQDDIRNGGGSGSSSNSSSFVSPPLAAAPASSNNNGMDYYEDPIPKKSQQKKHKVELLNDQKLQLMLEKDVRRSQKQIQLDQKNHTKPSLSAGNSPNQTPKTSPLPTPSTSTNMMSNILSPRLSRQKSAALLTSNNNAQLGDVSLSPTSPTTTTSSGTTSNGAGRLSRLFNTLSQMKQTNDMVIIAPDTNAAPVDDFSAFYPPASYATATNESHTKHQQIATSRDQKLKLQRQKQRQQQQQLLLLQQQQQQQQAHMDQDYYEQHHHLSLPTGQLSRFTSDFGNLAINKQSHENPPSLRNIRRNPEPLTPIDTASNSSSATNKYMSSRIPQQQAQHYPPPHRSNSNGRRPRMADQQRRLSATEYSVYYHHNNPPPPPPLQPQPHYTNTNYNNRYSTSEYYTHQYHQQQQAVYDYYQ